MATELKEPTGDEFYDCCPKCTRAQFKPVYHEARDIDWLDAHHALPALPERLVWKCTTCGYTLHTTLTFDYWINLE